MPENRFERIEKHLYKRQYQTTSGDWSTLYYGIFTDWKGKRRTFPVGSDLKTAREQLKVLEVDNIRKVNFDQEKENRRKAAIAGMTVAEWMDRYLGLMKTTGGGKALKAYTAHLKRLLGSVPLQDVTKVKIMEYKNRRLAESILRHGKPVEGKKVKGATVNREVSCLTAALNLAHEEGLCEEPPRVKKESEEARERILSDAEYKALLDASPSWLRRIIIGANEAALDRGVLLTLTWDDIKPGLVIVKGGGQDWRQAACWHLPGAERGPGGAAGRIPASPQHGASGLHQGWKTCVREYPAVRFRNCVAGCQDRGLPV